MVVECINRCLARRAAAEIAAADDDPRVTPGRLVERKVGPLTPLRIEAQIVQQHLAEAGRARPLDEARGNELVGVEVGDVERTGRCGQTDELLHERPHTLRPLSSGRTSARRPLTAAAATIAGDIRCVRAPGPCRPRKLRLVVDAQRSPDCTTSPLMPTHIEQPESAHSSPASRKMRSRPSPSACCFTLEEPGDTRPGTLLVRPARTAAAARKSSMRELVQEPMKTRSIEISVSFLPGAIAIYSSASRRYLARTGSTSRAGSGTRASIGNASSGVVPQVTMGAMALPSSFTSRSKSASGSETSADQASTARSKASPLGT